MQRILLPFLFVLLTLPAFGSNTQGKDANNPEVSKRSSSSTDDKTTVINLKMIEKFNNTEYSSNYLSINDLFNNYSFIEVKKIAQAHINDGIDISNANQIASVIDKSESEEPEVLDNSEILYSDAFPDEE